MSRGSGLRSVTVLFSDWHHTIHIVEAMAKVVWRSEDEPPVVNLDAAEQRARKVAKDNNKDPSTWDRVGVLVASDFAMSKGRIWWADDVERVEVVRYETEEV